MIKICVSGSSGKMGSRIIELAKEDADLRVCGCFDVVEENPEQFIESAECLIEFTAPQATIEHLALCEKHKRPMVIGTTGLSDEDNVKGDHPVTRVEQASLGDNISGSDRKACGYHLVCFFI